MGNVSHSISASAAAPAAVAWEVITMRFWPHFAAGGFHDPVRDDAGMRLTMHHGSGAGRSEYVLRVSPETDSRCSINYEATIFDVGWAVSGMFRRKLDKTMPSSLDDIIKVAQQQAASA